MDYKRPRIDLHIHSTASDGALAPKEIAELARQEGLGAISLTDHDSIDGCRELLSCTIPFGLAFISGVEISAAPPPCLPRSGSLHLLGYGMDVEHDALNRTLHAQQAARTNRTPKMIARLNDMGIDISMPDLAAENDSPQVGRPHIGRWLVGRGFAESMEEAFDRYLAKGRPAYVDKPRVPAEMAIDEIRKAGGVAVLAHPGLIRMEEPSGYEALVAELISMGLGGIEVFYPKHTATQVRFFSAMAEKLGLFVTGGSDYHGDPEAGIRLGYGSGDLFVPYRLYERLMDKLGKSHHTK